MNNIKEFFFTFFSNLQKKIKIRNYERFVATTLGFLDDFFSDISSFSVIENES